MLVAVVALGCGPAAATSFNCALAKLPAEVAICNDSMLSALDEEMASEYFRLRNGSATPAWAKAAITDEQRTWLSQRNACGYDMQCILGEYRTRIQRLGDWRAYLGI
jgi:uncharacterized protein